MEKAASKGARKENLKKALIDAGERIVSMQGLGAVKARDIAREADYSLGAIYTVFPDLDELVYAVNIRTLERLRERLSLCALPDGKKEEANTLWLLALSVQYLHFAAENRLLWQALFEHRATGAKAGAEEQGRRQSALFAFIEKPLASLLPEQDDTARARLARTLFSAVHGIIALGLEEKLAALSLEELEDQIRIVVRAAIRGLLMGEDSRAG